MVLVFFFLLFYSRHILNNPYAVIGPPIMPSDNGPLDPLAIGGSKQGWIGDRLAHNTGKMVKETIRMFHWSSQTKKYF